MMVKDSFENSLRLTRISLLVSGIRITEIRNGRLQKLLDRYLYYFNLIWLHSDVLGEMNWLVVAVITGSSFIEISLAIPIITICLLATAKSISLYLNRDTIVEVISKLREIHPEVNDEDGPLDDKDKPFEEHDFSKAVDKNDGVEEAVVKESKQIIRLIILMQYYICVGVVVAFPLMPVIAMIYEYYTTGNLDYKYPYLTNYFFDTNSMTMWPFVYFHQVWSTFHVGMSVFGSDTLFCVVCVYIQMHFRILCHRFENVVTRSPEQTRRNLAAAVRRHEELIHLVNQVEVLYTKSILFNIVTSSFLMCLSGFIIMMLEDVGVVISFATFFFHDLSQVSLLCYFGDMLMRSSIQISSAIYNSMWYETDERTKKIMFIVLIRAQRPCKLTACNFSDLNLSAFTTILSRSWSYFALLKTMYKP